MPRKKPPTNRPAHRPPLEFTDKDRNMVKVMVAGGIPQPLIRGILGISENTLRKHFRRELTLGKAEIDARVVSSIVSMATLGRNFWAAKWYTQARMGWSERVTIIDEVAEDVSALSDDAIAARLGRLQKKTPALRAIPGGRAAA